jgi:hypothetical protein
LSDANAYGVRRRAADDVSTGYVEIVVGRADTCITQMT